MATVEISNIDDNDDGTQRMGVVYLDDDGVALGSTLYYMPRGTDPQEFFQARVLAEYPARLASILSVPEDFPAALPKSDLDRLLDVLVQKQILTPEDVKPIQDTKADVAQVADALEARLDG